MKKIYSLIILLLATMAVWSQTKTWNGGSGNWNDPTRWEPMGVPAASDIIEFNGVSGTVSNTPALAFKGIVVYNSTVILNGTAGDDKIVRIGREKNDTAITIHTNASLTIGNNLNIALADNSTALIDGTLLVTTNRYYYTNTGETTSTIVNGTIRNNGGTIVSLAHMLQFKNESVYEHARDKGIIPAATWDKNSTCSIEGVVTTAPTGLNQVFGNYKWNCPNQASGISLGNAIPANINGDLLINKIGESSDRSISIQFPEEVNVGRNFILNEGSCIAKGIVTINIAGNFSMKDGILKANATTENAVFNINFNGVGKQIFSKTGGQFEKNNIGNKTGLIKFTILNGAIVDFGESVLKGDLSFSLMAGAQLMTAHAEGISLKGATGAIQVTGTRTYSPDSDYAYNGSVAQKTGDGLPATVRRLIINNTSGNSNGAGVILSQPTAISKELVLANGFLQTTNDKMLTIMNNGDAIVSGNSFVAGPLRKKGNTAFTFPTGWVGSNGGRVPIGISSLSESTTIQAEYRRAPASNKGKKINSPLVHISYCEYWELFPIAGSAKATVTMYRNEHSSCNPVSHVNNLFSFRVAHSDGSAWTQHGNSYDNLVSGNGYIVSDAGISINAGNRYFTLGNISTASDPLPVMFDQVTAYEKNDGVIIEWSNLTEREIATYFVERSTNGLDYTILSQQLPKSNRDDKANYIDYDTDPEPGINFYRIKVIEKNTKIIFSKVLRIERGKLKPDFNLYPNPLTNSQFILELSGIKPGKYNLSLFNAMGQAAYQSSLVNNGNSITRTFQLPASVNAGIYNLIITGSDYRQSKILIVQ